MPERAAGRILFGISNFPISFDTRSASSSPGPSGSPPTVRPYAASGSARNSAIRLRWGTVAITVTSSSFGNTAAASGSSSQSRAWFRGVRTPRQ